MSVLPCNRLAPEAPFPAAVHDVWEALLWSVDDGASLLNLDLQRYSVGGSSAGANLAAVTAQRLVSRPDIGSKLTLRLQLLVVPVTDNTATVETNRTWKEMEFTPALSALKMMWYRKHYLPDPQTWTNPEASPLLFPEDKFGALPQAQILVGELDVLRHEGEEFGRKLRDAGVTARVEVMRGMPHRKLSYRHQVGANQWQAFMAMDSVLDEGRRAITVMCESLEEALYPRTAAS